MKGSVSRTSSKLGNMNGTRVPPVRAVYVSRYWLVKYWMIGPGGPASGTPESNRCAFADDDASAAARISPSAQTEARRSLLRKSTNPPSKSAIISKGAADELAGEPAT